MILSNVAPSGVIAPKRTSLVERQLVPLEFSDRQRRAIDGKRWCDDVDARSVRQARVAYRARLIHAAADLADDALADGEQLCIVPKADIGLDRLAADFDEGLARAVDHDIGDVVACEKRLQRPVAQNVIADVFEQFFLLGNRHGEVLDRDDIVDDITNFLARAFRVELGEPARDRSYR